MEVGVYTDYIIVEPLATLLFLMDNNTSPKTRKNSLLAYTMVRQKASALSGYQINFYISIIVNGNNYTKLLTDNFKGGIICQNHFV